MTKGPIYRTEDAICSPELLKQLRDAIVELEEKMKASAPIMDGKIRRGWGVSKVQRGIAADAVISIVKAIKALKGW